MEKMSFFFEEEKTAQAAAYLLSLLPNQERDYGSVIKLLYLADRRVLQETGSTITGAEMTSMDNGLVLSEVYDCVNNSTSPWSDYISEKPPPGKGHNIRPLKQDCDFGELSDYEMRIIKETIEAHRGKTWRQLKAYTKLEEWEDPHGSSLPVDVEALLEIFGKSKREIGEIVAWAKEIASLKSRKQAV